MTQLELRSHHWIVDGSGNIVFGRGRMIILESIAQTGSINQTAKNLRMSYKTVWSKIKSTEKHLQARVVIADRSKGTHVTRTGERLVQLFKQMRGECIAADDRIFDRIFKSARP